MKKALLILMLLVISMSVVIYLFLGSKNTDEIYEKWNNAFTNWRSTDDSSCYGYITTSKYEAFIYNDGVELYCGQRDLQNGTQELYYRGKKYYFTADSDTPAISSANQKEQYDAIKAKVADGILAIIDATGKNYDVFSEGIFGEEGLPLFCDREDQILILSLKSPFEKVEFAHMAYKKSNFKFVHNINPHRAIYENAVLLLSGKQEQLYGWGGYDIRQDKP